MKHKLASLSVVVTLALAFATSAIAQSKASGNAWVDLFGAPDGGTFYPQYAFKIETRPLTITGYGFVEKAPGEPWFTNHVNTFSASGWHRLVVRTETGGNLENGHAFFQVGPQANLHEIVPPIKRVGWLIIAQLPKLAGGRPPNTLIAGGTNKFQLAESFAVSAEGYHRFFPSGRPDYAEFWGLVHIKQTQPISFGVFVLQSGSHTSVGYGVRIAP